MKSIIKKSCLLITILTLAANFSHAQLNGFELTPSGNTENYMKYIRKAVTVNGTSYLTGYLTLSSFKNFTTNAYTNDITPFQKLQIQGGNILLCHSNSPSTITDINPTSRNGAILFSDWASDHSTYKHGKWGIEYDNQYSTGGLNIFKPVSQLTSSRVNFNLFISNAGNVGVGIGDPTQKLDIDGNIRLRNNATIGTWSNNSLTFNTNSIARMVILADGKVGVGTTPATMFHVAGEVTTNSNLLVKGAIKGTADINQKLIIAGGSNSDAAKIEVWKGGSDNFRSLKFIVTGNTGDFQFFTEGNSLKMKIDQNGNVGIGVTTAVKYKLHVAGAAKFDNQVFIDTGGLYVNGEVKAKKYLATISPFPDFVFEPGYKLLSINEVERFINKNGHLPGVPNAAQVEQNGIELCEMNALLLQKIEELTLYIIAQDKKIQALETVVIPKE